MADGRHLENRKRPCLRNGLTDLHKIWDDDAFWPSEEDGQLKFPTFENPRWRTAAILKKRKRPYLRKALTDLHKIWHDDAFWPSEGYGQLTFRTFKNTRCRTAAILKVEKRLYLRNCLTDLHKIWHGAVCWSSEGYGQLKFPTFENPRWRTVAVLKNSIYGHISETAWPTCTKFGTVVPIGTAKHTDSYNFKFLKIPFLPLS